MTARIQEIQTPLDSRLIKWNKLILTPLGLWPENFSGFRFYFNFVYYIIFVCLEYVDFFIYINNFEHVLLNLMENAAISQIVIKMYALWRSNENMGKMFKEISSDFQSTDYTEQERKIFVAYHDKARTFVTLLIINTTVSASSYYFKPFLGQIGAIIEYAGSRSENSSIVFTMPYCFYQLYELTDVPTYFFTYGLLMPLFIIITFSQCSSDCFMVTMVYHISGQMAILALRITNFNADPRRETSEMQKHIRSHIRLLGMGKIIEDIFSIILFVELISTLLLICILGHQILICLTTDDRVLLTTLLGFISLVLFIFYTHCTVGERLILESNRLAEAYYKCNWYQMSNENAKVILLCIQRSQRPMQLTAESFCTFCLRSYANIINTSLGYLSVLRTVT